MHPELNKHPEHDQCTRNIGYKPAGILRDLKNRGGVIVIESGLEKRESPVAQWVIHENQGFPIFVFRGIRQLDAAGKVLCDIGPGITIVAKLEKLNRERFIKTFGPQHDLAGFAGSLKTKRTRESSGKTPGSNQIVVLQNRYGR